MSASNSTENALALLIFNNVDFAGVGDAGGLRGSVTPGNFFARLHTADPGEGGNGDTNQISYTGYAPVSIARTAGGFAVSGSNISNAAAVQFNECTAGGGTATHFSITLGSGAASPILYSGALSASRAISAGITPLFNPGALQGTFD